MTISVMHVLGGLVAHGAELRVLELIRGSATGTDFEHHVFVLDADHRDLEADFLAAGAKVHWARSVKLSGIDLRAQARAHEIDVVHAHVDLLNGWVLAWARLAGVRTRISHMRSEGVSTRSTRVASARDAVLRGLISRNATLHLGVSPSALDAGFDPGRARSPDARVILSGMDLERLQAEPDRLPGEVVLLHVGRDTYIKNREAAVRVLDSCHAAGIYATLYFVGETSPEREAELRSFSQTDEPKLVFLGVRGNVPALVRGADVLLSTSRAEGMPGTVLEAALVGTRVVASDIPATRYLGGLLEGLRLVPLDASADDWAQAVRDQVQAGPIRPVPMDQQHVQELFDARRAVVKFEALWRETQHAGN